VVALYISAFLALVPGVAFAQAAGGTPAAPPAASAVESPAPAAAPTPGADPAAPPASANPPAPAASASAATQPAPASAAAGAENPAAPAAAGAAKAPAQPAPPPEDPDPTKGHILDGTGYVLPARTAEFGLFYMGYGITDWLSVGTSPGLWVIGPLLGGVVANVSVKVGVPITHWVNVGLEASPIYLHVDHQGSKARGFILPLTLAGTFNATASQDYSLGVRYVAIQGQDETDTDNQSLEGAVVTSLAQLVFDGRYRFTEKFGLYARAYYEFWEKNLGAQGVYQPDDSTTIEVEGEADPNSGSRPWAVILGTHLRFSSVNLRLGVGYGNFFVPRMGPFIPEKTVFPDLDFYVRF
jgi:hypothetical protein